MCTSVCFCQSFFQDICVFYLYLHVSVLEADIVADLAGGSSAGLGQKKPPVGANANLVDSLPGPRGRGAGGGLPLRQPHQANPPGIQRDLRKRERKWVRPGRKRGYGMTRAQLGQTKKKREIHSEEHMEQSTHFYQEAQLR